MFFLWETKLDYVNNQSVLRACFSWSPLDYYRVDTNIYVGFSLVFFFLEMCFQ